MILNCTTYTSGVIYLYRLKNSEYARVSVSKKKIHSFEIMFVSLAKLYPSSSASNFHSKSSFLIGTIRMKIFLCYSIIDFNRALNLFDLFDLLNSIE